MYYFYYSNLAKSLSYTDKLYKWHLVGYIKMEVTNGSRNILFHLMIVIRGLAETNFTYLDSSDVSDLKKLDESYKSGTLCEIN